VYVYLKVVLRRCLVDGEEELELQRRLKLFLEGNGVAGGFK
jgi:hypothetical protein